MPHDVLPRAGRSTGVRDHRRPVGPSRNPAGRRIHEARLAQRVALADLAHACGYASVGTVSNMLGAHGRCRITPDLAVAAERLLGLDACELIRLDNEQVLARRLSKVVQLRQQHEAT